MTRYEEVAMAREALKKRARKMYRMTTPKSAARTELERLALGWLNAEGRYYDYGAWGAYRELKRVGAKSGIVDWLTPGRDTVPFFHAHKEGIAKIVREEMCERGTRDPEEMFGREWDAADPFAAKENNQNILVWFAFEAAARHVALRTWFEG